MRVSVVIPTRNRPQLLERAIAGVVAQAHSDVELIVVDDGSRVEDAARNATLVEAVPGARHLVLQPADAQGSGPSFVRNAGVAAATGELVAFCDDDDFWVAPDFLASAVAAFAADGGLDMLFGNQEAVAAGVTKFTTWLTALDALVESRGTQRDAISRVSRADCLLSAGDFAHMNTCVFRKTLLDAVGGFDTGIRYCEDLDLFLRAVDRARDIAYLRRTVSIHNVPDRKLRDNASTRMDERSKYATVDQVARGARERCVTPEVRDYCRRLGANACRVLALEAAAGARGAEALDWARRAGDWRPSLRWSLYTLLLRLRRLVSSGTAAS